MKKIIQILFVCAILLSVSNAQTITHKALSSGASKFDNASLHVTSSTGIVFGTSLSAGNLLLTQGFQQGVWKYFKDQDGDTYGNRDSAVYDFAQPLGYVLDSSDCNDFDSTIHNTMRIANIIGLDSLAIGSSFNYTDSTANGIWSLSTSAYASINVQGLLNALSAGLDTIKYTVQNGCGTFVATKPIQIIANPCLPSYVPTNGLVGWWPFCGNANDESGNGNNGVVTGATLAADRFGNSNLAYSLNGVNDFITIDSLRNYNFNSQITISAWFNSNSIQQKKNIVTKYGGFMDAFSLDIKPSQIEYNVSPGSANWSTCSNNTINLGFNSWHNVTATYDFANNLFKIYFDGIIVGTKNASSLLGQASNVPVIFGYFYDPNNTFPSQHFDGDIDDIGIWNRALSPSEIQALYLSGQPCPNIANIQGPTSVNVGSTITLTDSTANGTWSSSNTAVATIDTNGVVTGITAGTTAISYIANLACGLDTAFYTVTVSQSIIPTKCGFVDSIYFTRPTTFCFGDSTVLNTVTVGPSYTYSWYNQYGALNDSLSSRTVTSAGTYYAIISNGVCSDTSNAIIVNINYPNSIPSFTVGVSTGTILCVGDSSVVSASLSSHYNFTWYGNPLEVAGLGPHDTCFTVHHSGNYHVFVSDPNSVCPGGVWEYGGGLLIFSSPSTNAQLALSGGVNTICLPSDTANLLATPSWGYNYQWLYNGSSNMPSVGLYGGGPGIHTHVPGNYQVIISAGSCKADTSNIFTVGSCNNFNNCGFNDSIYAASPTSFLFGDSTVLHANFLGAPYTYSWYNQNGALNSHLSSIVVKQSGAYYAIISNGICSDTSNIITTTVIPNPCLPSYVPTNGLVGWWPFCGNANDESGNGNHAVNYGSLLTTDRNGSLNSAYSFDSTYMVVNNSTSMNFDSISINLWYWNHEIKNGCFVSKHQSGTHNSSFVLYWENLLGCGPQWYITSSASGVNSVWASSLCDTTHWHMISATFANGIMRMYYDGVLFQTTNQVDIKNTSLPIVFGGGNSSPTQLASFTNAKLDDIGIWNRALTPAEIQSLYQSGQQCSVSHTTNLTICHRDSTLWNGKYYSRIGIDTVRLTSYQGCDSIDILNLNVHPFYYNVITQYFCQGDSIVFNGQSIKNAGTYFYHYTSITGCDSTVRLRALFYPKTVTKVNLNICTNGTVSYGGQTYSSAGVFAQYYTNRFGCDSIVQLTITKRVPNSTPLALYKCINDSISYNGTYYKSAGLYYVHYSNKFGCDSLIKLTIINRPNSFSQTTRYCCVGDSVLYNGQYYKTAGTYTVRYTNKYGCDSLVALRILNYPVAPASLVKKYICQGSTLSFAGQNFTQSGKYIIHLQNRNGCDSVVQLAVYYNPVSISSVTIYRCSNDSVLYNSKYYSTNGVYTVRLTNKYGCDSIVNLQVLTRAISTNVVTYNKCKSDSVLYQGKYYNQPGTYIVRLQNYLNCDSLISLRILNYPNTVTYITRTICNGGVVMYNGTQYTSAGVYAQHAINRYGCDSIIQITITKNLSSYTNITKYKCPNDSVQVNGQYYSSNGVYTIRLTNYKQCDSIITLLVLTRPVSYSILTHYICQGDSLLYNGTYYKQTGTYFIHLTNRYGCDSTVRLRLLYNNSSSLTTVTLCQAQTYTWNGTTYTWGMAGTYVQKFINYKGCDSIATLKVYRGNCKGEGVAIGTTITTTETVDSETSLNPTLEAAHNFEMNLYPNPNTGRFTLENNCTTCKMMLVEIFTMDGKLLYSKTEDNSTGKINIDVHLASGMYWVKMSNGASGYAEIKKFSINND
ncbi:MAG: T9SS type A sorting domain-containing protein [Chitinophagales bacterium]|nr:T9SS type A sorting domain-containing protein [Chitinophagales bacterium]